MKIVEFTSKLTTILHIDSISVRKAKILELLPTYQKEFDIVGSMALELPKTYKFSPKQYFIDKDFDFTNDMGTFLWFYQNNDKKSINTMMSTVSLDVQIMFNTIFGRALLPKVTAPFLYSHINHYYNMKEIYSMVELPKVADISNDYKVKDVGRNKVKSLKTPPYYWRNLPKGARSVGVYYITKDKGVITSNLKTKTVVNSITDKLKYTKYSLIVVVYKNSKVLSYKILAFLDGSVDLLKLYRGVPIALESVVFTNTKTTDSLDKVVSKNTTTVVISEDGVVLLHPKVSYVTGSILDWITDDDYNPVGLIVEYQDNSYDFYIKNFGDLLDSGLQDRTVVLKVQEVLGEVVSVNFNGIKRLWHTEYKHCQICKSVGSKHRFQGICKRCFAKIPNILKYRNRNTLGVKSNYTKRWKLYYGELTVDVVLEDKELKVSRLGQQVMEFLEYQTEVADDTGVI